MTMKALIQAIQTDLKNAATLSVVTDSNIFITPDEDIIPMTATFPAIGLKDGAIQMEMTATAAGTTKLWDIRYQVHVIIYVDWTDGETPIVGQTTPSIKGVLDLNDLIRTVLHEDYQSIAGILDAFCIGEGESEPLPFGEDMVVQKKRMTFEYYAQEVL